MTSPPPPCDSRSRAPHYIAPHRVLFLFSKASSCFPRQQSHSFRSRRVLNPSSSNARFFSQFRRTLPSTGSNRPADEQNGDPNVRRFFEPRTAPFLLARAHSGLMEVAYGDVSLVSVHFFSPKRSWCSPGKKDSVPFFQESGAAFSPLFSFPTEKRNIHLFSPRIWDVFSRRKYPPNAVSGLSLFSFFS